MLKINKGLNLSKKIFKFVDLFAGIGGFHFALHQLGGECVFASEIDDDSRITYERNFNDISPNLFKKDLLDNSLFNKDIRTISPNEIPDFDVLCAGFPCQPFSQAGYKKGFSDNQDSERGNLFFNLVDIINTKRPKAFFLENVRGIVNHDGGKTFRIIREILEEELKYSFYYNVVKASDFGLPQHRPRTFMIGFRDENLLRGFTFPNPVPLKFNMSDVFGGSCSREIGFTLRVGGAGSNINDRRNWDSYLVNNEVVRIQPNHALKIQGFPDNFKLPNSKSKAMKQLGNSVAIDAVKAYAKEMIDYMHQLDKKANRQNTSEIKKNKGEWSELYTFLKLILDKKIYFSDSLSNTKYDFVQINQITNLNLNETVKILSNGNYEVYDQNNRKLHHTTFAEKDLNLIKNKIINGKGTTFGVPDMFVIFNNLGIKINKGGNSYQKADIIIDFLYNNTNFHKNGLNIKSYFGSNPTLLNASGSNTNFVYEVTNFNDQLLDKINGINSKFKIKDRINSIYENGSSLIFKSLETETLQYNLKLIDSNMPSLLSEMLIEFYKNRESKLSSNLNNIYNNVLLKSSTEDLLSYQVRIKRFLISILLGMFTNKKWDGKNIAEGMILVKKDGSHSLFHIIKITDLEDFLLKSSKFDTPSSTRHRYGAIFRENDGKYYFKLNLQIRI